MFDLNFPGNYKKLKGHEKEIEPQEVFLDKLARDREEEFGISERKFEIPLSRKIFYGLYLFFFIIVLSFWVKSFELQVLKADELMSQAEKNRTKILLLSPERGVIYDRNLRQLVFNSLDFDLVLDKEEFLEQKEQQDESVEEVSRLLGKKPEDFKKEIEENKENVFPVSENISHEALISLEAKIDKLPGFRLEKNTSRNYIDGETFSHILGYTGKTSGEELKNKENYLVTDRIGKVGIEKTYEDILRGEPGRLKVERNALGKKLSETKISDPEPGKSLVLWLDAGLQKKIEEEVKKELKNIGAEKAAVIALDPATGGVLALVSIPSFDPNLFSRGISQDELNKIQNNPLKPFFNRAIAGRYLTGSIIKPLIASAALEEQIITPNTKLYAPLDICFENKYGGSESCYSDWTFHGWTDVKRAIAESVNPFFYLVGGGYTAPPSTSKFFHLELPKYFSGLGLEKIIKYLGLFGWGEKTQIDLPGEENGFLPTRDWKKQVINDDWRDGDTYNLSIGQGYLSVTPLQVATAISAIANGGRQYQPLVVQKIINQKGEIIETIVPKILRENFISSEHLKTVREGMRQAVTSGSAVLLNDLPVKAAAKTGTAQKSMRTDYYYNWAAVFAPYEKPEIVLVIVVEDVKGLQPVSIPLANEILKWYFSIEPEKSVEERV